MEGLRLVAAGRDRVRDAGWDVDPGFPFDLVRRIRGLHDELAREDVQRLPVVGIALALPGLEHGKAA